MTDVRRRPAETGERSGEVVLITGASGFIAAAVIAKLAKRYTVVGLDRAGPPDPPPPATIVSGPTSGWRISQLLGQTS